MIYNGLITLRLCGFPFAEIRSLQDSLASPEELAQFKVFLAPALICMHDGVTFTT